MDAATIGLTIVTGTVGLVFLGFLIWGIKSGQFHNVEDAKYQLFRRQKNEKEQDPGESERREVKSDAKP